MATAGPPVKSQSGNAFDVSTIWKTAIDRYEKAAGAKFTSLASAHNVDDILNEIHERESKFKSSRHDGSKIDKFRTLVNKSLKPIDRMGDVVAQAASSAFQPSTAIFTAVRFLISTANAVSADYDKIVGFFEDLDLYLNRLKILEEGVLPIPELKTALAEVLASALVLCGICAKYIKMQRIVKAFRNLVSGEDGELASAYAHFHKMVEHEQGVVRNATLAGVDQLRKETDHSSRIVVASTERVHKHFESQEATLERDKILKALSSLTFLEKQRDLFEKHHQGTGQWVLHSEEFQRWFKGQETSTLWCYGMPGGGKTVITSIAVNYISEAIKGRAAAITYLYCDYQDPETQLEVRLLSSIARQLTEQTHPIPLEAREFCDRNAEKRRNPTADEWILLIKSLCIPFQTAYIVVDALDECPEANRDGFLCLMKELEPYVRFFFTSRPHGELPVKFANLVRIEISADKSDIEDYLKSEIGRNNRLSMFIAKDPDLKVDIVEGISEKAKGMFLLAHLQITRLCRQNNIRQLRKVLNALPAGIYATYDDAMKRIEDQGDEDWELAKRALSFIFSARRPLNVEELRHALAVEPGDTGFDETAIPETEILLNVSGGLIRIDENSRVIRVVHHTLQEYFEANPERLIPNPEAEIARACLTYLSFDVFGSGPCGDSETLSDRLLEYHFLDYASRNWGYHIMRGQPPEMAKSITTFLEDGQKLSSSVQVLHIDLTSYRTKDWYDRFPRKFGPLHVSAYWGLGDILTALLDDGTEVDSRDSYGATALHVAARYGHKEGVQLLLIRGATINAQSQNEETALYWAARNGHREIVKLLLTNGAEIMPDIEGWTALNWAILGGSIEVVKALLDHDATLDPDPDNEERNRALFLAADEGNEAMVQMLLDNGADPNGKDLLGSTALDFAVPPGHEKTIRVLLQNGTNVNSRDTYDNTSLHWAVPRETIVRLLLENGADVHAKNDCGQTPLCWTAQEGLVAVAQLLLDRNAGVNVQDKHGVTALHRAALTGCEAMVRLLLENGADPMAKDKDEWTPLHAAAVKRHEKVVRILRDKVDDGSAILDWVALQQQEPKKEALLAERAEEKGQGSTVLSGLRLAAQEAQVGRLQMMLEKGADIDAKDTGRWTALEIGAFLGHEEVVQFLLEKGADANIRGSAERPPLYHAVEQENETVVPLLIEHGADVDTRVYGSTPIMAAAAQGNLAIVQSLIEAGADVNAQDYGGQTALHLAALNDRENIVQLLIEEGGADSNVADDRGRTVLMFAVENLQLEMVALLLDMGVSIDAKSRDGSTALHLAAFLGEEEMVQLLLSRGADVGSETQENFTALHIAALRGFEEVVQLLLDGGADVEGEVQVESCHAEDDADVKSLSQLLRRLLLEEGIVPLEVNAQHGLTARQLATRGRHEAVQQLLR